MGAAQNSISKNENNAQLSFLQSTPTPSRIDLPVQQDPLSHFLKKKDKIIVKVKTLTDVQKESDKIKLKYKQLKEVPTENMKKNTSQTFSAKQNNVHFLPDSTITIKKEIKENIYNDTPTKDLKKTATLQRKSDDNNGFKNIAIQTESFMKVRQESPLLYYDLQQMIGQGSFGQVFKVKCKKTDQIKAIKILKTKFMKQQQMKGILSQITLQSKLNHPSIVSLYDLFQYQNVYYVVMEYCNGGSIVQLINKISPKSEIIIANIMKQVLRALSYLHSLNIVHRDIKLQNMVFLNTLNSDKGYIPIKIIDFGAAVKSKYKVVQNYPIAGTFTYISPQTFKGVLTDKSDIWSAGVLMYILLTGISPFKGKNQAQTKQNITKKLLNFKTSPSSISPQARDLLENLLNRNMFKRISANDALNHPWLSKINDFHQISIDSLQKLETYYRGNNLISIIQSYLTLKKVTQEERQILAKIFMNIDTDGNGLIQKQELINILKTQVSHFIRLNEQAIDVMVSSIDKDSSGKIDFNEFIIAMYDKEKLYVRQSLNEAFQYFDKDHTGFIQINELKSILHGGDAAEVEYFISQIDEDKDKRISRQEFISYLLVY